MANFGEKSFSHTQCGKVVCTLGAHCRSIKMIEKLLKAGMDIARFDFSYGSHAFHQQTIHNLRAAVSKTGIRCDVMLDTKGPHIRTGFLKGSQPIQLKKGREITVSTNYNIKGDEFMISMSYKKLAEDLKPHSLILCADGTVKLTVLECDKKKGLVRCRCETTALLGEIENVDLPGVHVDLPTLTEKDMKDILCWGVPNKVDIIALSFVRKSSDLIEIRNLLKKHGVRAILMSKLNEKGVMTFVEIPKNSNALMVAREIEIPIDPILPSQGDHVQVKPTKSAIETLEPMVESSHPARDEATEVANAVVDSKDAFKSDHKEMVANQGNPKRTLKELLAAPDVPEVCIRYPNADQDFELKMEMISQLPSFHGLSKEDPYRYLKEFHFVCSSLKPRGVTEEQFKLKAFPFSLKDDAKEWFYYLPSGIVTTWNEMQTLFLEKYFPISRAGLIRKEIYTIEQLPNETLYEYWDRFNKLCASCPEHQIDEQLLIQYFYEGLTPFERTVIDIAGREALTNKTPQQARELISTMAANSDQFSNRSEEPLSRADEVNILTNLEQKISNLTALVERLVATHGHTCHHCATEGHSTDLFSPFQNGTTGQQHDNHPYAYTPQWRYYPNIGYDENHYVGPDSTPRFFNEMPAPRFQPGPPQPDRLTPLEDLTALLESSVLQLHNETNAHFKHIEAQIDILATAIGELVEPLDRILFGF